MSRLSHAGHGRVEWSDLPLERNGTLLATRGTLPAFRQLHSHIAQKRGDVRVLRMNFKLFRVANDMLKEYRRYRTSIKVDTEFWSWSIVELVLGQGVSSNIHMSLFSSSCIREQE